MSNVKTLKKPKKDDKLVGPKLDYGFAVLIGEDGHVYVERSVGVLSVPVNREATLVEVRRYISEILSDLQAQAAAEYTIMRMAQIQHAQQATPVVIEE